MRREWSQGGTTGDWDRLVVISPRGAASPSCSFLPSSDPRCFRAIIYPLPAIFGQTELAPGRAGPLGNVMCHISAGGPLVTIVRSSPPRPPVLPR